jgi:hypothetical protein
MDQIKTKLIKIVKKLGSKETITHVQAGNKIGEYRWRIVSEVLSELHQEGWLIERGSAYSLNPSPRRKPIGCKGKFSLIKNNLYQNKHFITLST